MVGIVGITMAGLGSRFAKDGYACPKYEIEALGRPLFDWSLLSLSKFIQLGWKFRFAVRDGLSAPEYIKERCKLLGISIDKIVILDEVTDGQATTGLLLCPEDKDSDLPFAIYNIDTAVAPNVLAPPLDHPDGLIPCFKPEGDRWSFVKLDDDQKQVIEVREKERISDLATLGLYYFKSGRAYRELYKEYFSDVSNFVEGERYIAPMYNLMINKGMNVQITTITLDNVGMLGNPEQLQSFINAPPRFCIETQYKKND